MLEWLTKFLIGSAPPEAATSGFFDEHGEPVESEIGALIAVLLMEAARANSAIDRAEIDSIFKLLEDHIGLKGEDRNEIVEVALLARQKPERIEKILSHFRKHFDEDQRMLIMGMLWKVVLADGTLDEWETKLTELAAERLELSAEQTARARQMAESGEI